MRAIRYPQISAFISGESTLLILRSLLTLCFLVGEYDVEAMFTFNVVAARSADWPRSSVRADCSPRPFAGFFVALLVIVRCLSVDLVVVRLGIVHYVAVFVAVVFPVAAMEEGEDIHYYLVVYTVDCIVCWVPYFSL